MAVIWVLFSGGCGDGGEDTGRTPKYPDSELPKDCDNYTPDAFIHDYVYARCRIELVCTSTWDSMDDCVSNDDDLFECEDDPPVPFGCGRAECIDDIRHLRDNLDELGCDREPFPWSVLSCAGLTDVFEECTEAYE